MSILNHKIKYLLLILILLVFLIPNVFAVTVINVTQLTYGTNTRDYGNPSWSPEGSKIAYSAGSGYNYSIWIMNANGSNQTPLTKPDIDNPVHKISTYWIDSVPRWSSDSSEIVFQRVYYDDGGGYEGFFIYIINTNGLNQKMLISGQNPSISPDGRYIAFDAGYAGGIYATAEQGLNIFVMNVDGTNIKRLTADLGDEVAPSWSPDGKKIVFTKSGTIHIMDSDGSNTTNTGQTGYNARWSPNGKYIAFISERAGDMLRNIKLFHIYVMDIDGTNVTQLTFGDNRWDGIVDWSPDGTKVVFDSAVPSAAPTSINNIYIMTLDFNATPIPTLTATQTPMVTQTSAITPIATTIQTPSVPSFSLLSALVSLSILVLVKRSKR